MSEEQNTRPAPMSATLTDCPMCEGMEPVTVDGVIQNCEGCTPEPVSRSDERLLNVRADIEGGSECTGPLSQVEAGWLLADRDHYAAEAEKLQFIIDTLNSRMARTGKMLGTAQSERDAMQKSLDAMRRDWNRLWVLFGDNAHTSGRTLGSLLVIVARHADGADS